MRPEQLSEQLRNGTGDSLRRRRGVIGLALTAVGSMGVVSLFQTGIIRHLPDPPLPYLDSDRVDASSEAYTLLQTPDAALGIGSYAVTLILAAMGDKDRATERPWIPLTLAAKALFDAAQAGKLTVDQWRDHRAFCLWCLIAAGANFATVPLTLPEARAALNTIRG